MSMSVGGVQFPLSVVELEMRVIVLEKMLEAQARGGIISQTTINQFRAEAKSDLAKKYPELGIT